MHKKDDKESCYRNLRVDDESYKRIDLLCKREGITKLSCVMYMTRFFVENGVSFMPGKSVGSSNSMEDLKKELTYQSDRVIKVVRQIEKEYIRGIYSRITTLENDTAESLSYQKALLNHISGTTNSNKNTLENLIKTEVSSEHFQNHNSQIQIVENLSESGNLSEKLREAENLKEKAEIRLKGALELLERVISPDFCTMLEESEFAPRTHKFKRADIEEIKGYIRQCTSI